MGPTPGGLGRPVPGGRLDGRLGARRRDRRRDWLLHRRKRVHEIVEPVDLGRVVGRAACHESAPAHPSRVVARALVNLVPVRDELLLGQHLVSDGVGLHRIRLVPEHLDRGRAAVGLVFVELSHVEAMTDVRLEVGPRPVRRRPIVARLQSGVAVLQALESIVGCLEDDDDHVVRPDGDPLIGALGRRRRRLRLDGVSPYGGRVRQLPRRTPAQRAGLAHVVLVEGGDNVGSRWSPHGVVLCYCASRQNSNNQYR